MLIVFKESLGQYFTLTHHFLHLKVLPFGKDLGWVLAVREGIEPSRGD